CPSSEPCFTGPVGTAFNIQYGYGRPNVLAAAGLVDSDHIPPSANLDSPAWYQLYDPKVNEKISVSADVSAPREGGAYTWQLQWGLGPQPLDNAWKTFASGAGAAPATVSAPLDLAKLPKAFWNAPYSADPNTRLTIEQYDVTIRVRVFANGDTSDGWAMGE